MKIGTRFIARGLVSAVLATVIPVGPADASGGLGYIDPLTHATVAGALVSGALTARAITTDDFDPPKTAPVTFVPFPIVDPTTKKPVTRDTIIVAPSGVKVAAGDYWDAVNAYEKFFNARGVSLRTSTQLDLGTLKGGTQAELEASKKGTIQITGAGLSTKGDVSELSTIEAATQKIVPSEIDSREIRAVSTPFPTITVPSASPTKTPEPALGSLPYGYKSTNRPPLSPLPASVNTVTFPENSVTYYKQAGDNFGSHALGTYLTATLDVVPLKDGTSTVNATLDLSAYLFYSGGDIATASIRVAPDSSKAVDIEAGGQTILKESGKSAGGRSIPGINFFTVTATYGPTFQPMFINASVSGVLGVQYAMKTGARNSAATFVPEMDVAAAYKATQTLISDNFLSSNVSVQGNLTLADVQLPVTASAGYALESYQSGNSHAVKSVWGCRLHYVYDYQAAVTYTVLQGKATLGIAGCLLACKTFATTSIFDYAGLTGKDTFFHISGDYTVGPVYEDLQQYGYTHSGVFSQDDYSGMPTACDNAYNTLGSYPTT